jgi:uncharacterized membrane protein
MDFQGFFQDYFLQPLYHDAFNPINTTVYAALFLLLIILILRVFERFSISFDSMFYSYFLGFIFLGAFLGALKDMRFQGSLSLSTPGIYFGLSLLFLGSVLIGKVLERRMGISYSYVPQVTVFSFIAYVSFLYIPRSGSLIPGVYAISLGLFSSLLVLFFLKIIRVGLLEGIVNFGVFFAHMLDASSTYLGITRYGFSEKFFITGYIMEALGPWAIFIVKAILVLLVLYVIEQEGEIRGRNKDAIKAALILLGMAPALRNTFLSVLL